jgi:periplasmic protein TonB
MFRESMFRESLLETSAATITQRSWATAMSFGLEMAGIGVLLLAPMIVTQTIPLINPETFSVPISMPHRAKPDATEIFSGGGGGSASLTEPGSIPRTIPRGPDPRPRTGGDSVECNGCIPDGGMPGPATGTGGNSFWEFIGKRFSAVPAVAVPPAQKKITISRISDSLLLSRVEPRYPAIAVTGRVQGEVLLAAVIDRDGRIVNLRVVSGHPMLAGAALDAVRQWRYRPTLLNGQPVEVDTTISVRFTLRQD